MLAPSRTPAAPNTASRCIAPSDRLALQRSGRSPGTVSSALPRHQRRPLRQPDEGPSLLLPWERTAAPRAPGYGPAHGMTRILDALAFSSLWVAAAAMSLAAASSRSFGARPRVALLAFVFAGTLAVYSVDRLRDVARDRLTAPVRSVWVERHRKGFAGMAAIAALLAG